MGLAVAIGLGIAAGLTLDSLRAESPAPAPEVARTAEIDPESMQRVLTLRDEAQALTPAEVGLDERAQERWMPRVAKIERALEDPATPPAIREQLDATIAALECVGLLEPTGAPTCVTIGR